MFVWLRPHALGYILAIKYPHDYAVDTLVPQTCLIPTMCVMRSHKHKNCSCQFVTQEERCEDYKQKYPKGAPDFIPTLLMETFRNSTQFIRQRLDGIEYTTIKSFIFIGFFTSTCPHAEDVQSEELAEVRPFCDDRDVQHQLDELVN